MFDDMSDAVVGIVFGVCIIIFILGIGFHIGQTSERDAAVQSGVGHYSMNITNGEKEFVWGK